MTSAAAASPLVLPSHEDEAQALSSFAMADVLHATGTGAGHIAAALRAGRRPQRAAVVGIFYLVNRASCS